MIISRLEIEDFGKFTGKRVLENLDSRVVLIFGKNEAGKTTIFNLIKSILYGFFPAQSHLHPYSSWKNGRIEFTAFLKTFSDNDAIVYRKLLSKPQGQYIIGEKVYELRNNPLPVSKHISREIYDKIYSLRVEDLIEIQGKAWEEVEDKLLAGYSSAIIRNSREVLSDLKVEYEKIWRENGRGKYLVKELEREIKELKKLKKEACSREDEIRKAYKRINEIDSIIEELKDKKIKLKTLLRKSKELMPLYKAINQIDMLNNKLIKENLTKSIPINIKEKMTELRENLENIRKESNSKEKLLLDKANEKYVLNTMDKLILENKVEINILSNEYTRIENLRENIDKVKMNINRLKDRLFHESENLLTKKWNSNIRSRFENINKSELKILVSNYRNITKELKETKLRIDFSKPNDVTIRFSKGYIYGILVSIILIMFGFIINNDIAKISGFGIGIYGLTGIVNYFIMKKNIKNDMNKNDFNNLHNKIYELENKLKEEKEKLINYLEGIPISNLMIENMDEMFLPSLIKIKDMVYELNELEKDLYIYQKEYDEKENEIKDFLMQFLGPYDNEGKKIFWLKDRLDTLEKKITFNENINREIDEITERIQYLKEKEKETDNELQDYTLKLEQIGNGDIVKGVEIVEENYRIKTKIDTIKDELNEITEADNYIKEIEEFKENEEWIFSEYEVLKAEDNLEEINQRHKELEIEKARLEEIINKLLENLSLDEIESRISLLEDDLERAYIKRDKLMLLSEIIRFADQRFKEYNQPDALKNAGKYFNIITNGKYTDIYLDEDEKGKTIMIKEAGSNIPKKVADTFSKGTLNQIYLSLRLSLIDYLDKDNEALPICFDEMLVNWDEERLDNTLQLLNEVSNKRQIFIFTCHDWMAGKIEKYFNIKRMVLD